jgi:hypothetical protein
VMIVRLAWVLLVPLAVSLVGCSESRRNDPTAWYNKTMTENFTGRSDYDSSPVQSAAAAPPAQQAYTLPPAQPADTVTSAHLPDTVPPPQQVSPAPPLPQVSAVPAAQPTYNFTPAQRAYVTLPPQPPPPAPVVAAPYVAVPPTELYRSEASCGTMVPRPGPYAVSADISDIGLGTTECEVARHYGPPDRVEVAALPNGARTLTLSYLHVQRPRVYHFANGRLAAIDNLPAPIAPRNKRAAQ